jgi:hypothetical protein
MNKKMCRLGALAVLCAVVTAVLATMSPANASAAVVKPDGCPTDKPLVVNSYATFENAADSGADGHVWALDAATHSIRIWRLGGNAYCVQLHDVGTFTTFGGLSPEGTGTVSGGVTGSIDGTIYLRIYGTFAPTVATTGFVGNFDEQCQQDGTCSGPRPSTGRLYFSSVFSFDVGAFAFTADGGACGTWYQSTSGDTGDIVC